MIRGGQTSRGGILPPHPSGDASVPTPLSYEEDVTLLFTVSHCLPCIVYRDLIINYENVFIGDTCPPPT